MGLLQSPLEHLADMQEEAGSYPDAIGARREALKIVVGLRGESDWRARDARRHLADCEVRSRLMSGPQS